MTELEKREKALEKTKQKYPHITDEKELNDLMESDKKKKNILLSIAMLVGGLLGVIVYFVIGSGSFAQMCLVAGSVCFFNGIVTLVSTLKKPKQKVQLSNSEKTVIDFEYLKGNKKRSYVPIIIKQSIAIAVWSVLIIYVSVPSSIPILIGIPLVGVAVYWMFKLRQGVKYNKLLDSNKFKILKAPVFDKEDETRIGTDSEVIHEYYLIYKYVGENSYKITKEVKINVYNKYNIGDFCYLLLFFNERWSKYEIESIFSCDEAIISPELAGYVATDEEIAAVNKFVETKTAIMQMWKVRRVCSYEDGCKIHRLIQSPGFLRGLGLRVTKTREFDSNKYTHDPNDCVHGSVFIFATAPSQHFPGEGVEVRLLFDNCQKKVDFLMSSWCDKKKVIGVEEKCRENERRILNYLERCARLIDET